MPATARVTILMDPAEKASLAKRAKAAGCASVSEYLRRKAALPDHLDDPAVDVLLRQLADSTQRANAALDAALAAMDRYERRWGPEPAPQQNGVSA
ncbi:MAG TPA: hypothetical protein VF292_02485 [Rhodanobacteraceae bacterium]